MIAAFLFPSAIFAQGLSGDEEQLIGLYGDEELISIATGLEQPIAKAPAVASVVTAKQISAMGARDLDEVLETIPGLHVSFSSGYNPIYVFRGIYSSYNPQVLVLINGIPITNLFHGDRHQIWGGMPLEAVERIEVIRGPGSAVYGADAFAGVINIITKTASDFNGTELKAAAGSFNSYDLAAMHSSRFSGYELMLAAEFHKSDGSNATIEEDAQTLLDQLAGTTASLAPGAVSLSRENLDLRLDLKKNQWRFRTGLQSRRDHGIGAGVAEALDPHNRYKSDRFNADITWNDQFLAGDWDVKARLSYLHTTQEIEKDMIIFPPGVNLGNGVYEKGLIGNPENFERHTRLDADALYNAFDKHDLRVGAGYFYGDMYKTRETKNFGRDPATGEWLPANSELVDVTDTPYIFLQEGDRKNTYVFIQDVWQLAPDWELTAGLRHDNYSDFGSTTNPRLVAVWSATQKLTTKLLFGEAFRAPSFAEMRNINNPVVLGNPDLDPEKLRNIELGFYLEQSRNLNLSFNMFQYEWSDIIRFVPDAGDTSSTAQNTGERIGTGCEFELLWKPLSSLSFAANYSWVDTEDKDAGDVEVAFAPHQQAYISANWAIASRFSAYMQVNRVMERIREPGDERGNTDDYALADIALDYAFSDSVSVKAVVDNLFDTDAREPTAWSDPANILNDLPLAERSYRIELRLSL